MEIVRNTHNFNSLNNENIININIVFFQFLIILFLLYKNKFFENIQNEMNNKLELQNKKYLYLDDSINKLIYISNNTTKKINTFDFTISKIKKIIKTHNNEIFDLKIVKSKNKHF